MVEEGCLENVDEVYGHHNWPTHNVGILMVKSGPVMAEYTKITIKF